MGFGGINAHVTLESGDPPAAGLAPDGEERALLAANQESEVFAFAAGHAEALHGLGVIACKSQQYGQALEFLSLAAERKPDSAIIHQSLGVALQAEQRWEESANAFARAIAIQPDSAVSVLHLGATLHALGRTEDAASCFCSFDSDRCCSRFVRTIRWRGARPAGELTRLSNSGPRSPIVVTSAATVEAICESQSSPTRAHARISYRRNLWLG